MTATDIIKEIREKLKFYNLKLSNFQLSDKSLAQISGSELSKGTKVSLLINSKPSPLAAGDYKSLDGSVSFTIDDQSQVSKVDGKLPQPDKKEPVKQAQASDKKVIPAKTTTAPDDTKEDDTKAPADVDAPEDDAADTSDSDSTEESPAPLTMESLMSALQPLLDSIKNIESSMCEMKADTDEVKTSQASFKKELTDTREALIETADIVEILSNKPDGKPIEPKKNQFKQETPVQDNSLLKTIFGLNKQQ